jgi:phosphatidylglycerol:prolipoprotein diacylglycerol transferase
MIFPAESVAGYLHPYESIIAIQLISSLGNFLIFVVLTLIYRKKKFHGQVFFSYFVIYAVFRFMIEFFRGDYLKSQYYLLNLTLSQWTGFFLFAFGLSMLLILRNRYQQRQAEHYEIDA